MVYVGRDEVIASLKKFKSYAKQEMLASDLAANPDIARVVAQSRKDEYERLIDSVEKKGVGSAYDEALAAFEELRLRLPHVKEETLDLLNGDLDSAATFGRGCALVNFLRMLGYDEPRSEGEPSTVDAL